MAPREARTDGPRDGSEIELPVPEEGYYRPERPVGEVYPCWRHLEPGDTAFLHGSAIYCNECHPLVPEGPFTTVALDHGAICGGGHTED